MSFVGNCGTFTRGYRAMILDVEFLYHLLYLLICAMGLFVHEFFYSLLVSLLPPSMLGTSGAPRVPLVTDAPRDGVAVPALRRQHPCPQRWRDPGGSPRGAGHR